MDRQTEQLKVELKRVAIEAAEAAVCRRLRRLVGLRLDQGKGRHDHQGIVGVETCGRAGDNSGSLRLTDVVSR